MARAIDFVAAIEPSSLLPSPSHLLACFLIPGGLVPLHPSTQI